MKRHKSISHVRRAKAASARTTLEAIDDGFASDPEAVAKAVNCLRRSVTREKRRVAQWIGSHCETKTYEDLKRDAIHVSVAIPRVNLSVCKDEKEFVDAVWHQFVEAMSEAK